MKDLDDIVDCISGIDGGVAFAKLYHGFYPEVLKKAKEGNTSAQKLVDAFALVAGACRAMA